MGGCGGAPSAKAPDGAPAAAKQSSPADPSSPLAARAKAALGELPAPPQSPPELVALGRKLFFEKRVSADGNVGCVTCHDREHFAADGIPKSKGAFGRLNARNAPTIFNAAYQFAEHKANIVASLNEMCKALADIGVIGALHQHTGTCVETRDETYATMEAVDTRYVKFGPDVGQLQKGGVDPVKVVKDFLPAVRHVHMKDFDGGPHYGVKKGEVKYDVVEDFLFEQREIKWMFTTS